MAQPELGLPEVGDVFQVATKADLYDQKIRTVLHYKLIEVGPGIDADRWALYNTLYTQLMLTGGLLQKLLNCQTDEVDYETVRIQQVFPVRRVFREYAHLFPGGLSGEQAVPANVAIGIIKRTGRVGRLGHGTMHIAGCPISWLAESSWIISELTPVTAFANEMVEEIAGAGGEYRFAPCLAPAQGSNITPALLTGAAVQTEVRTMYRRTKGIGE